MKTLHKAMGGNQQGFFIIRFGHDMESRKAITTLETIAWHTPAQANWSYQLVRGKVSSYQHQ